MNQDSDKNIVVRTCPFHKEKTGSFSYSVGHNRYHCFGCGKEGTIEELINELLSREEG